MQTKNGDLPARFLSRLLGEGYGHALLGDLAEERERRLKSGSPRAAARWYRNQLYRSLAAVLRLRAVELACVTPWGIAMAAYVLVGVLEFGFRLFLSWVELLGVPDSRFFRQVRQGAGSVAVSGRNVTVTSEGPAGRFRERYLVRDNDSWVYRLDVSSDGGQSWNEGRTEFTLRRSK
jgi:hypothetical protein